MSTERIERVEKRLNIAVAGLAIISIVGGPLITFVTNTALYSHRLTAVEVGQLDMTRELREVSKSVSDVRETLARIEERVSQKGRGL